MTFTTRLKMQQIPPFLPTGGVFYTCDTCNAVHHSQVEPAKCKVCIKNIAHLKHAHRRHVYDADKYCHHVETRFHVWAESPWQNPRCKNETFIQWRKEYNQHLSNNNKQQTDRPYLVWLAQQTPPARPVNPPIEWVESFSGLSLEQWLNTPSTLEHHLKWDYEMLDLDISFDKWLTLRNT